MQIEYLVKKQIKLNIYILCNQTSCLFHQFFQGLKLKFVTEEQGNIQILISQTRPCFAFNQFRERNCLFTHARRSKTTYSSELIF